MLSSFGIALLLLSPSAGRDAYPRADPLVEPAQLAKPAFARKFIILDARAK